MKVEFTADKVQIETGKRVDNSGKVTLIVGEYMLKNILPLGLVIDQNIKVTIEIE